MLLIYIWSFYFNFLTNSFAEFIYNMCHSNFFLSSILLCPLWYPTTSLHSSELNTSLHSISIFNSNSPITLLTVVPCSFMPHRWCFYGIKNKKQKQRDLLGSHIKFGRLKKGPSIECLEFIAEHTVVIQLTLAIWTKSLKPPKIETYKLTSPERIMFEKIHLGDNMSPLWPKKKKKLNKKSTFS